VSTVPRTALPALLVALALALVLAGCSGGDEPGPDAGTTTGTTTSTTVAAPKAPRVGACYQLDVRAAFKATSSRPALSCSRRHTSVTVAVGTVRPVHDGHLLALSSSQVQRQIAQGCQHAVDRHVGGSVTRQRLSRVQAVWFNPTPAQADQGALWYRCDLVISAGARFASLPRRTTGLLNAPGALDRWGTCGTAAPSSAAFRRVLCSARHTWRARATTKLPAGTTYLSKKAAKLAESRCRDVAAKLSPNSTTLRWSFEWPTRAQWHAGQRYGFCWTPG